MIRLLMKTGLARPAPRQWNSALSPISLAAYATWGGVVFGPASDWLRGSLEVSPLVFAGFAGQLGVLFLFVLRARLHAEPGGRLLASKLAILLQIPAALAAAMAFNDGLQPALLCFVVVQLALAFAWPVAAAIIVATDACLGWILLTQADFVAGAVVHSAPDHLTLLIAYLAFQAFTILAATYARDAEEARDEAIRINAELLATRRLLDESTRNEERLHLSRELHDVAGHKLTALKLRLTLAERRGDDPAAVLAESRQLADELLTDIRSIVGTLREHDGVDLKQSLLALTGALPYPPIELKSDPGVRVTGVGRAEALLRCAQEGLTNVLRHSGATRASVTLAASDGQLQLSVEDNGRGVGDAAPGNGLTGLRERLAALGGALELRTASGGGTRLVASLPEV
jgi:signal transduction histidine kinase